MEGKRISYHESIRKVRERIKKDGMNSVWDRFQAQGFRKDDPDKRCPFCLRGARCDLCSNGPCRADASIDKRGVCGITADGMAMRMMLLRNILGVSTYHYHTETTIRTLKATIEGTSPFSIREPEKLKALAKRLGLKADEDLKEIARKLYDFIKEDFNRDFSEPSRIVEALAPKERKELWKKLGIFPGGIYKELLLSTSSCLTNVDGYYASLALKAMRLGIAMAYQSQIVNEFLQDVMFNIPRPHEMRVNLGVLDPDYVNIIPNGHEPFVGFALVQLARKQEWQERAKAVGAKGLRVIANIETGQEMIQRWEMDDVFYGFTGNWIAQEAVLASGCVDAFVCDMNCCMPIDPLYAKKYKFKLIPVSEVVAFEGVSERLDYKPEEVEKQGAKLLQMAIDNFKERRATVEPVTGLDLGRAIVGFSTESILKALGGSLEPLLDDLKKGKIRGIAGLISCTTLRDHGQDVHNIDIAKELIKRDVLVLSMGCGNAALQVGGLCTLEAQQLAGPGLREICEALNIPPILSYGTCTDTGRVADLIGAVSDALGGVAIPDLPIVVVAPEYMEQKATIDAIFALAFGLYTYVNPVPTVTGGPDLVRLLTQDCKDLTGGILHLEKDTVQAVDAIMEHIEANRKKLGI
ncbi:MAG: anaerobic carbon-monoxide dehydrogenase catalytic subunit [Promethearchaeota archaeon]